MLMMEEAEYDHVSTYQRDATISYEDEMPEEEDSDFEYLPLPGPDYTDDNVNIENIPPEAIPLCEREAGKKYYKSTRQSAARIPFSSIHLPPAPFESRERFCFLPGQRVDVEITDVEHSDSRVLNPNLYTIQFRHGDYHWTIKKRYKHFRSLHDSLLLYRAKLKIPVPTRLHRMRRRSFKHRRNILPRFPRRPEAFVREEDLLERKKQLGDYLRSILRVEQFRNYHETVKFLEVSHLSFVFALGAKNREGLVKKRSGGRSMKGWCTCCGRCLQNMTAHYNNRWLVLKDTFLAYINPDRGTISDVLLMDNGFDVQCGLLNTGVHHGLVISSLSRQLVLKTWTQRKAQEWKDAILDVAYTLGKDFSTPNRYDAFTPMRMNSHAQWFVDGAGYMSAVADAMEAAKEEIFITDWWLSPEIYMKRPMTEGDKWRLDVILKRKAMDGVRIFVILFKEMEMALGINSYYTKQALMKLHPTNIKVLRHPDLISMWSHHEKMVVIDQRIAFLGGIDLCYGRYDTPDHRLTDVGSIVKHRKNTITGNAFPTVLQEMFKTLTDLGSILTSPELGQTQGSQDRDQPHRRDSLERDSLEVSAIAVTPGYDRSISSHSWPETEIDRKKLYFKQQSPTLSNLDETDEMWSTGQQQLEPISEFTQRTLPQIVIEGVTETEVATDEVVGSSEGGEGGGVSLPAEAGSDAASGPPGEVDSGPSQITDGTTTDDKDVGLSVNASSPSSDIASQQAKTESPVDGPKSIVLQQPKRSELKIKWDDDESSGPQKTNGEVNHGASMVLGEPDVKSYTANSNAELTIPTKTQPVFSTPKTSASPGQTSGGGELIENNNNSSDKAKRKGASGVTPKKKDMPEPTPRSPWRKLRAIRLLARWQRGTESPEPSPTMKRAKRPPNLNLRPRLHRQDRIDGSESGNSSPDEFFNFGFGPKPTTPKPRKKLVQKAHDLKFEVTERFRRRQSKSVDIANDSNLDFDFRRTPYSKFYKTIDEPTDPEGILEELGLQGSTKIWIGKDYCNFISKDFVDLDKPFTDFIDRTKTPRMPWHDIGAVVYGKAARDVARHFIQRWNFTKVQKRKTNMGYPLILPKAYSKVTIPRGVLASSIPCNIQFLRSSTTWSAGISQTESSIHSAYIDIIQNAKHYIYIENQFFISVAGHDQVENSIANAIYERIIRAHKNGEVFRVYVVMPLLPAFEGEIGTSTGGAIQAVTHWNYASMCRGGKSLMERLRLEVPDPRDYLTFYGLRTHGELSGRLITELVYVHSKLMIIDDRSVIIGSANINDRSLMGKRDSEIAILVEDTHMRRSRMNGKDFEAGWFASSLRKSLFREHLGVKRMNPDIDVTDPVIGSFYKGIWITRASINTSIYDSVFRCIPSDSVRKFSDIQTYQRSEALAQTNEDEARELLSKVSGNLVFMPLKFLSEENVQPTVATKEGLAPAAMWT